MNGNGFTILNPRLFAEIIFYMVNKIIRTELLVDMNYLFSCSTLTGERTV